MRAPYYFGVLTLLIDALHIDKAHILLNLRSPIY